MVELTDLSTLLANFGSSSATFESGDLDGDVDLPDLAALLWSFDATCA